MHRPVHVCHRAGTPGAEPMAVRLPHGLQDALRYASRSQNTGLNSGIGSNSFDHCGAFGDALCVLRHCITCHNNEREQHDFTLTVHSPIRPTQLSNMPSMEMRSLCSPMHFMFRQFRSTASPARSSGLFGSPEKLRQAVTDLQVMLYGS